MRDYKLTIECNYKKKRLSREMFVKFILFNHIYISRSYYFHFYYYSLISVLNKYV